MSIDNHVPEDERATVYMVGTDSKGTIVGRKTSSLKAATSLMTAARACLSHIELIEAGAPDEALAKYKEAMKR